MRLLLVLLLLRLGTAHDVFTGTTTLDCALDHHACETSGTVMLGPGENFTMTTHPDHDVKYVSMGHLEANRRHANYLPKIDGINTSANVVNRNCTLEFFSVVWFCNTHEDITLPRNATYSVRVPSDARHAQFVAWGRTESLELVLGLTVQRDAARARHKVGGMSPGSFLGWGSFVTVGVGIALLLIFIRWYDRKNKSDTSNQNAWIAYAMALVSHVWFVVQPLHRALSSPYVLTSVATVVEDYYETNVILLILTCVGMTCCPLFDLGFFQDRTVNCLKCLNKAPALCKVYKHKFGVAVACVTAILYVVVVSVPHVTQLHIGFVSTYAAILLASSAYFYVAASSAKIISRIQQCQCLVLLIASLVLMQTNTNDTFFTFSAVQWAISILILQVVSVQTGATKVDDAPVGLLESAVFVSVWAVLFFDVTSYGLAIVMLYLGVLRPVWQYVQA